MEQSAENMLSFDEMLAFLESCEGIESVEDGSKKPLVFDDPGSLTKTKEKLPDWLPSVRYTAVDLKSTMKITEKGQQPESAKTLDIVALGTYCGTKNSKNDYASRLNAVMGRTKEWIASIDPKYEPAQGKIIPTHESRKYQRLGVILQLFLWCLEGKVTVKSGTSSDNGLDSSAHAPTKPKSGRNSKKGDTNSPKSSAVGQPIEDKTDVQTEEAGRTQTSVGQQTQETIITGPGQNVGNTTDDVTRDKERRQTTASATPLADLRQMDEVTRDEERTQTNHKPIEGVDGHQEESPQQPQVSGVELVQVRDEASEAINAFCAGNFKPFLDMVQNGNSADVQAKLQTPVAALVDNDAIDPEDTPINSTSALVALWKLLPSESSERVELWRNRIARDRQIIRGSDLKAYFDSREVGHVDLVLRILEQQPEQAVQLLRQVSVELLFKCAEVHQVTGREPKILDTLCDQLCLSLMKQNLSSDDMTFPFDVKKAVLEDLFKAASYPSNRQSTLRRLMLFLCAEAYSKARKSSSIHGHAETGGADSFIEWLWTDFYTKQEQDDKIALHRLIYSYEEDWDGWLYRRASELRELHQNRKDHA